jgi:hypothetical protein
VADPVDLVVEFTMRSPWRDIGVNSALARDAPMVA